MSLGCLFSLLANAFHLVILVILLPIALIIFLVNSFNKKE